MRHPAMFRVARRIRLAAVVLTSIALAAALSGCASSQPGVPDSSEKSQTQEAGFSEAATSGAPAVRSVASSLPTVPGKPPGFSVVNGRAEAFGTLLRIDDGKGVIWAVTADPASPTSSQTPPLIAVITNPADLTLDAYVGQYVRLQGLRMHGIDLRPGVPDMHVDQIALATR